MVRAASRSDGYYSAAGNPAHVAEDLMCQTDCMRRQQNVVQNAKTMSHIKGLADQSACVAIQRAMDGDEVCLLHELFKRDHANAELLGQPWVDKRIESYWLRHSEASEQFDGRSCDAAETHRSKDAIAQFDSYIPWSQIPFTAAHQQILHPKMVTQCNHP